MDGSPSADAALAFAFHEAMLREWEVEAVYGCWELSAVAGTTLPPYANLQTFERNAGALLERAVAPWREKYPQVRTWTSLRLEQPRQALREAADGAGLLVVGDRGEGGLPDMRLGAVSGDLLRHSPCPIAVVH